MVVYMKLPIQKLPVTTDTLAMQLQVWVIEIVPAAGRHSTSTGTHRVDRLSRAWCP